MQQEPPSFHRPFIEEIWAIFIILHERGRAVGFEARKISISELLGAFELFGIRDYWVRVWYSKIIFALDDHLMASQEKSDGDT